MTCDFKLYPGKDAAAVLLLKEHQSFPLLSYDNNNGSSRETMSLEKV